MSKPAFNAYTVRNYEKAGKDESYWTKVGALWPHKDGKGFDLQLEALPTNGRIIIRVNEPKAVPDTTADEAPPPNGWQG